MDPVPGIIEPKIGPYIPVRTIGEGTTGKVKLAYHKDTNENVAIKIISKSNFEKKADLEMKVQREIALMRLTNHPNIMKLIDVFESPRHLYIVLEYAQQGELFDYLISRRVLPEDQALDFFRQIILAIEYLHEHGICHRDLKPENILLDSCTRIKIADFGFARWVKSSIAETSCGSPHYAAPEVISGKPYDGRKADIWSCGIILFALLAGYLPFDDASIRSLLHKVKRGVFQMPAFPPQIADLIQRMLTVDVDQRITIAEIKQHPCFLSGISPEYQLPHPLPFAAMGPMDIDAVPEETILDLERIGFSDREELREDLATPENTMAKVFLTMLLQRHDFEALPWDASESASPSLLDHSSFMMAAHAPRFKPDCEDPFQRHVVTPSESYSLGAMSVAQRTEWSLDDGGAPIVSDSCDTFGIPIWQIMFNLQLLLTSMAMQWFHPDPMTLVARHEETGLIVTVDAVFRTADDVTVGVSLRKGELDGFNKVFEAVKAALGSAA